MIGYYFWFCEEGKNRNIDGVNVDIEYAGNPGQEYRDKYTKFVADLSNEMHKSIPYSKVTVSVPELGLRASRNVDFAKTNKKTVHLAIP